MMFSADADPSSYHSISNCYFQCITLTMTVLCAVLGGCENIFNRFFRYEQDVTQGQF